MILKVDINTFKYKLSTLCCALLCFAAQFFGFSRMDLKQLFRLSKLHYQRMQVFVFPSYTPTVLYNFVCALVTQP